MAEGLNELLQMDKQDSINEVKIVATLAQLISSVQADINNNKKVQSVKVGAAEGTLAKEPLSKTIVQASMMVADQLQGILRAKQTAKRNRTDRAN